MVRLGQFLQLPVMLLFLLPMGNAATLAGLILTGAGCAPIYPSLLHATPENFGAKYSQSVMGMQMACAYVGTTLMPPLFGFVSEWAGIGLYPFYLLLFVAGMFTMTERMNRLGARGLSRGQGKSSGGVQQG